MTVDISQEEKKVLDLLRKYGDWVDFVITRQAGRIVMLKATEAIKIEKE